MRTANQIEANKSTLFSITFSSIGSKMMRLLVLIWRTVDFFLCLLVILLSAPWLPILKLFIKDKKIKNDFVLSITKDGINRIIKCNGPSYFEWDFTRPHAKTTILLYIGNERTQIFRLGKKVIGINISMPFNNIIMDFLPFTTRCIQQFISLLITVHFINYFSPKVLEVMFPTKLAMRALILKKLFKIKLVAQIRGNLDLIYYFNPFPLFFPFKIKNKIGELCLIMWDKFICQLFYQSCDLVIGYNLNNMLSSISNGAHPSKTRLSRIKIEQKILTEPILPRNRLKNFPQEGRVLIVWSRISPEKMILECVKAFENLMYRGTDSNINLVIIGDGPDYFSLEQYVKNCVFFKNIILLGHKDRSYIASAAHYSDLALVPYGGSSLLEAVFMKKPVIAFDIEWHNELIRHGETGWLADFPDFNDLADKIQEALSNPREAKLRADNAFKLAEKMFSVEQIDANEARYLKSLFI